MIVEPSASSVWKNVALVAFLFNCFGITCGGAFHSHFPYLGLFGQQDKKAERDIIVNYFKKLMLLTYVGEEIGLDERSIAFNREKTNNPGKISHYKVKQTEQRL